MDKQDFRILVADDDDIARDVVSHLLLKEGYSIETACDGAEAIRFLTLREINLVITDLRMPGPNGLEVLRHAVRSNPDIAVIILTAYSTLESAFDAMKEGAFDYLTKPFKIQEILFAAEKAFKRALLIEENRELRKQLRDTYRDAELLNQVVEGKTPRVAANWVERVAYLTALGILNSDEASQLNKRLAEGNGQR